MVGMEFEWDERKRQANLAKHGIDFIGVTELFDGRPVITVPGTTPHEERYLTVGQLAGRVITVVWTRRNDAIRFISARRARTAEIAAFTRAQRHLG